MSCLGTDSEYNYVLHLFSSNSSLAEGYQKNPLPHGMYCVATSGWRLGKKIKTFSESLQPNVFPKIEEQSNKLNSMGVYLLSPSGVPAVLSSMFPGCSSSRRGKSSAVFIVSGCSSVSVFSKKWWGVGCEPSFVFPAIDYGGVTPISFFRNWLVWNARLMMRLINLVKYETLVSSKLVCMRFCVNTHLVSISWQCARRTF